MSVSAASEQTLVGMLYEFWRNAIISVDEARIDLESCQVLIDNTRAILRDNGVSPENIRVFFRVLSEFLTFATNGHPVCRQFIPLLQIEAEA